MTCLCLSLILNLNVKSSQVCAIKVSKDQLCCFTTLGASSSRLLHWKNTFLTSWQHLSAAEIQSYNLQSEIKQPA